MHQTHVLLLSSLSSLVSSTFFFSGTELLPSKFLSATSHAILCYYYVECLLLLSLLLSISGLELSVSRGAPYYICCRGLIILPSLHGILLLSTPTRMNDSPTCWWFPLHFLTVINIISLYHSIPPVCFSQMCVSMTDVCLSCCSLSLPVPGWP